MSRQRTMNDAEFWRSPKMAGRTQEDRAMLCYLLTSPFSNIIGAYPIVPRIAASEMGWDSDSQLLPVIRRLAKAGFVQFDAESSFVWVRIWWDHNSAKMAVAGTLRQRTFEQIDQIPIQWQAGFVADLIDQLPHEGNLRSIVRARFDARSIPIGGVLIPRPYPTDTVSIAQGGNTTDNPTVNANTTTTEALQFPRSLSATEIEAMRAALHAIPMNDAQQLLDEVAGALQTNSIKKTPSQFLHGLVHRYQAGNFHPSAGVRIADKRRCALAVDNTLRDEETASAHLKKAQALLKQRS